VITILVGLLTIHVLISHILAEVQCHEIAFRSLAVALSLPDGVFDPLSEPRSRT
jgi:hypothetical protein